MARQANRKTRERGSAGQRKGSRHSGTFRAARALIGWLPPELAHSMLTSMREDGTVGPDEVVRAKAARVNAARRAPVDQRGVVGNPPSGMAEYLAELRANLPNFFAEGWRVCTVDMSRLYALQPSTFMDYAQDAAAKAVAGNMRSIANVTLPLSVDVELAVAHDGPQKTWTLSTRNLNLQVMGPLEPSMGSDGCGVGYKVCAPNSIFQVAHFDGRFFCRDGHHRAYQLLRRGISQVPALVRDFKTFAELAPKATLLPEAVLLGERPPTLRDFLSDDVSAEVRMPATRKAVVITAAEIELPV